MGRPLVIVESPAKARTIERFLGNDFQVEASVGHIRDLPKNASEIPAKMKNKPWARLGVDVEEFRPIYVIPQRQKDQVQKLKTMLADASALYLATDEDREGESISWHLVEVLKPDIPVYRLVFHEITRAAIQKAIENPRAVDMNLVQAQEARRILDRLYGYEVSPLLWKKVRPRLSAGRVQSVAVRLVVERERQRLAFRSAQWWDVAGPFDAEAGTFRTQLTHWQGTRIARSRDFEDTTGQLKKGSKSKVLDETAANHIVSSLSGGPAQVAKVENRPFTERPAPPFTTSTMQQEANRKFKWTARRTMSAAQRLYEAGWISYMR
ncbi:MAG: DNA topoisomerase, partial [Myxococcota bacterium]|nr:DNA topoisomerase [Myxococcota bacterium]